MPENNIDLDLTFLYDIADGSNEFIVESVGMFLEQSPEMLQSIGDSIETGDWASAASSAHKIKANLGFFGMLNSQALIQEIEIACKDGGSNPVIIKAQFDELTELIETAIVKLKQIKAEKEAGT